MKIVVIGGSGLIGKKLIPLLGNLGHDALSASPSTGVNTLTGVGLDQTLQGADVVVDVSNSPSFADDAVMEFFKTSTSNLVAAQAKAHVQHFVILSVVGADRIPDSGYLRAKAAQEAIVASGSMPYTIVRATQFFEFLGAIADGSTTGDQVRLPTAPMQPIAADDVALALAEIATAAPANRVLELAGPESLSMAGFIDKYLKRFGDSRTVIADPQAGYFGAILDAQGLNPGKNPIVGKTSFEQWQR